MRACVFVSNILEIKMRSNNRRKAETDCQVETGRERQRDSETERQRDQAKPK